MQDQACLPKRLNPEPERTSWPLSMPRHPCLVQRGLVRGHCREDSPGWGTTPANGTPSTDHGEQGSRQIRLEKGYSSQAWMLLVHPQYIPLVDTRSCARGLFLTRLSFQQSPENNLGRTQANHLGTAPNLCLGLPATINITLGVADAHRRGE